MPSLTVAENVFLGSEPRRLGFIRAARSARGSFERLADEAGFELPRRRGHRPLRAADQQKVEILRALARGASLIIMDEPTAALSRQDADRLHEVVRCLTAAGRTVLLVSHFLSEVLELADTVTILRDGRLVRTAPAAEETEATLIDGHARPHAWARSSRRSRRPRGRADRARVDDLHAPGVNGVS